MKDCRFWKREKKKRQESGKKIGRYYKKQTGKEKKGKLPKEEMER